MTANSRKSCRYRDTTEPRRDGPTDGHAVTTRQHTHTSRHTSAWKACGRNDCSRQPSPAAVQSPAGEAKTTTRKKNACHSNRSLTLGWHRLPLVRPPGAVGDKVRIRVLFGDDGDELVQSRLLWACEATGHTPLGVRQQSIARLSSQAPQTPHATRASAGPDHLCHVMPTTQMHIIPAVPSSLVRTLRISRSGTQRRFSVYLNRT